ncbi:M20/M25/M40 family metallo-hydrolase [Mycoplasmatota bacterium WC44]
MLNKDRMIKKFIDYVLIDSETHYEKEMMEYLLKELKELGFNPETDNAGVACECNGNNIYVKIPGNDKEPVLLSSHMDTVQPGLGIKPQIKGHMIYSDGTTILGADDKSGIAIITETLRVIKENNLDHRPIEILLTIFEEGGLNGAKNADYSRLTAQNCLVFDSGGPLENIVVQAIAQNKITAKVIGKAAHAGGEPENGINALVVAARAIENMKLSRIDHDTTANIGIVKGGLASNIVMPEVTLYGEARSLSDKKLEKQSQHMKDCFEKAAKDFGAQVEVEITKSFSSFKTDINSDFAQEVKSNLESLGHEVNFISTGGGSDANIYAEHGINSIIMSTGLDKPHTLEESLDTNIMAASCEFLIKYLTN